MKINVYTDLHIGAPNEIGTDITGFKRLPDTILIGDIIDLANCKKSDLPHWEEQYSALKKMYGSDYIEGNHERDGIKNPFQVKNKTIFCHGDLESNGEKWRAYRSMPRGASWFKRNFIVPLIEQQEKIIDRKLGREFLENAALMAGIWDCETYVCGHFHPKETIVTRHKNINIVILSRGKSVLEI